MNIEYLENRRNLPSIPVETSDLNSLHSFQDILYRNALETAVLSAVFPNGAPQSKGKIRKRQRNPLKGWKLQLIRNLAEAPRSKGTPLKLHRKQAMRHLLCSDMLKFRRKLWAMDERNWAWSP